MQTPQVSTILAEIKATSNVGVGNATSIYGESYQAKAAFDENETSYWCSDKNAPMPVLLWFQFKSPQLITKLTVKFHAKFSGDQNYLPQNFTVI